MSGRLKVEAVTSTLAAIGGSQEDLDRIIFVIEPIFRQLNPPKKAPGHDRRQV